MLKRDEILVLLLFLTWTKTLVLQVSSSLTCWQTAAPNLLPPLPFLSVHPLSDSVVGSRPGRSM
jgi:hypothetical protein